MSTPNSMALEIMAEMEKALDDAVYISRVEKRINDALDEIAVATNYNMFKTRSTFSTVAGQAVYQLPVGGREISQLRYTDTGEPIWNSTTQEAARWGALLEQSGRARIWIQDGILVSGANTLYQFRLSPVPNSILTVEREFYYHPSEIASAVVIPIQDQYLPLVRRFVRASLLFLSQQYDQADRERQIYEKLLDGLVKQEKRKVAAETRMCASDLRRDGRRGQAQFDPSHYRNSWV